MLKSARFSLLSLLIAAFAAPLLATTYIVPSDAEMIQKSDDIVVVTGVSMRTERNERGGIVTRYTVRVVETLKGGRTVGSHLVLTELGGELGDEASFVPGAPEYQPGERYLVFTTANRDFEPVTFGMSLGRFHFVDQNARRLALRTEIHGYDQNFEEYHESARDAQRFVAYIRDTVAQRGRTADYFVPNGRAQQIEAEARIEATAAFSRTSYLMRDPSGTAFRWQNPSASWVRSGTQPGTANADTAVNVAFAQWNGTATNINYTNAGVDNTALGGNGGSDSKNAILYNDPTNEIPDGSGIAGQGGVKGSSQYTLNGETFWNVREADVVIANMTFTQSCLNGVMTHEVGHTLGFRHSNQVPAGMACGSTAECTSSAIMNSSVNCSLNGILQGYDKTAAETVYGDGSTEPPACNPPTVTTQPQSRTVSVGAQTTIGVVMGGTGPFSYQWFNGDSGNTSSPVNGANSSSLGVSMNAAGTAKFWVRIGHQCDNAVVNSATATITANAVPTCTKPLIATQPVDSTIDSGQAVTLSIAFSSGATVKWYRGNAGDKSNSIGTTASVSTGALGVTTKFWAEVTNSCGAVSSRQVTVTVRGLSELVPMLNNRFYVQVRYKNQFDGNRQGKLLGRSLFSSASSETAVFTFGDQNVIELMVRLSDARPFDNNIHVFLGGLSDVEFFVVVTDSKTGIVHEYGKPANRLVGVIDRDTFPGSTSALPGLDTLIGPDAETSTIRLLNNRYQVRMRYRNQFTSPATTGYLNARSIASTSTTETAVFYFGANAGSGEWMVRFSDARPFANRIDMFHGGLSDVELTIEVLDTKTGARKEYAKAPGSLTGQVDRTSYKP